MAPRKRPPAKLDDRKLCEQRRKFIEVAKRMMEEARKLNLEPVTKDEMDELSGF